MAAYLVMVTAPRQHMASRARTRVATAGAAAATMWRGWHMPRHVAKSSP